MQSGFQSNGLKRLTSQDCVFRTWQADSNLRIIFSWSTLCCFLAAWPCWRAGMHAQTCNCETCWICRRRYSWTRLSSAVLPLTHLWSFIAFSLFPSFLLSFLLYASLSPTPLSVAGSNKGLTGRAWRLWLLDGKGESHSWAGEQASFSLSLPFLTLAKSVELCVCVCVRKVGGGVAV